MMGEKAFMKCLSTGERVIKTKLEKDWHERLVQENSGLDSDKRQSIICWLLGEELKSFETLTPRQVAVAERVMNYRYEMLRRRYLNVEPKQAYCNLLERLGYLCFSCCQVRSWVCASQERKKTAFTLLSAAIEDMLKSDRYLQSQVVWIASQTKDRGLQNGLLLSSIEEYCSRSLRNRPVIACKIIYYLQNCWKVISQKFNLKNPNYLSRLNKNNGRNLVQKFSCPFCQRRLWRLGSQPSYLFERTNLKPEQAWLEDFFCEEHGHIQMQLVKMTDLTLKAELSASGTQRHKEIKSKY
jgi:hypothetical protein